MLNEKKIIDNVVGNRKNIMLFLKAFNNSIDSSCWIIKGPKGIGKAKLVSILTEEILNLKRSEGTGINEIAHPDLFYLKKNIDEKRHISVERTREIIKFFSRTAFHTSGKVAIIDSISELNNYGLNSLLKLLEEPPKKSNIFLIDHQLSFIPSTITSRCKTFLLKPLDNKETLNVFTNLSNFNTKDNLEFFVDISSGRPGLGLEYIDVKADSMYEIICNYFVDVCKSFDSNIIKFINILDSRKRNESLKIFCNLLQYFFLKVLYLKIGKKVSYFLKNEENAIIKLNNNISVNVLFDILDYLKNIINDFQNFSLNAENIVISICIKINSMVFRNNE